MISTLARHAAGRRRRRRRDGRGVTGAEPPHESPSGPILLLAGQGFALGLTMAWILIPASAIFLAAYGSELLPVTYIGAAIAGVVSSIVLAAAFRRRPLAAVATRDAGRAVGRCSSRRGWCWRRSDADWVSFALLVLVPIVVPVGFIFVVGQAGMLLDVRVLKAFYARVVAGFALGFVAGGLAGPLLLTRARRDREPARRGRRGRRRCSSSWSWRRDAATRPSSRCVETRGRRRGAPDAAHAGAQPLRDAHRRVPDAVGGREPVARLPRARAAPRSATTTATRSPDSSASSRRSRTAPTSCSSSSLAGLLLHRFGLRYGLDRERGRRARRWSARSSSRPRVARVGRHDRVRPDRGRAGHRPDLQRRRVAHVVERRVPGGADPPAGGGPGHGRGAGGSASRSA